MSDYNKAFETFTSDMNEMGLFYHEESYHAVMKYLGPSVFKADSALVACSDPKEIAYIREHFLVGKLGLDENDSRLDDALRQVCHAFGESNPKKHRPTFYYLLMAILRQDFEKLA